MYLYYPSTYLFVYLFNFIYTHTTHILSLTLSLLVSCFQKLSTIIVRKGRVGIRSGGLPSVYLVHFNFNFILLV